MEKPSQFYSIQVLRGIAAVFVMLLHVDAKHFLAGWAGVDLFFVISGFIMGTIGVQDTPGRFMLKRAVRIVPLYWLATGFTCAIFLAVPHLLRSLTFDGVALIKSLLFIPYFAPNGYIWPMLPPGWTLNFEMFFYAVFALALFTPRPREVALGLLGALVLIGLVLPVQGNALLETWTSLRLVEFGAGLVIAMLPRWPGGITALVLFWAGAAGSLASPALFLSTDPAIWERVAFCLPFLAMTVLGALGLEASGRWPRMRVPEFLGDISYSLYLLHYFVVTAVHKLFPAGFIAGIVAVALSIAVAALSHALIEQRFSNGLRRVLLSRPKTAPAI